MRKQSNVQKVTAEEFLKNKPLTLNKDVYNGYNIPYSYLVSLLEEYAKVYYDKQINEVVKELPTKELIRNESSVYSGLQVWVNREKDGQEFYEYISNESHNKGAEWMKQQALPIIAKYLGDRERFRKDSGDVAMRNLQLKEKIETFNGTIAQLKENNSLLSQQKDKEIERLSILLGYLNRQ